MRSHNGATRLEGEAMSAGVVAEKPVGHFDI